MSDERRLEYDKGPALEDEERAPEENDDPDTDEGSEGTEPTGDGRLIVALAPWKAGTLSGVGAFALVFAATYQLVGAMFATGMFARAENEPSQWAIAGLTMLGSHGATIEENGEPIQGAYAPTGLLTSHVSALLPVVILALVGYLLVRYVPLETVKDAGFAIGTTVASYAVLATVLALLATWAPEADEFAPEAEPDAIAVTVDASMLFSTTFSVLLFVTFGAAVAALPRLLEYVPVETTNTDTTS
ncbi:hypothetical protein CV102_04585 [Natronococcus pandeyae]|uniref:DUF7978 domain-containing protein n=1 Tax=Natronococcus pandeyae TaxID=2055836 RepID=A0A8J8Q3L5_9EURY|nr:hypothetical protein [Natronococcus pandeyae]TYL39575.1 hypothetical protein CV102_04585 [Natronococcus pandeyae]